MAEVPSSLGIGHSPHIPQFWFARKQINTKHCIQHRKSHIQCTHTYTRKRTSERNGYDEKCFVVYIFTSFFSIFLIIFLFFIFLLVCNEIRWQQHRFALVARSMRRQQQHKQKRVTWTNAVCREILLEYYLVSFAVRDALNKQQRTAPNWGKTEPRYYCVCVYVCVCFCTNTTSGWLDGRNTPICSIR